LDTVWRRKHTWLGHVLGHDSFLKDVLEGKMITGRKRLNILSDLVGKYMVLKRVKDRKEQQKLKRAGSHISFSAN